MPEPDLYRPLIGLSVRLTERLTSRLPKVYRDRLGSGPFTLLQAGVRVLCGR